MSTRVHYRGAPYDLLPGETLLTGLVRQGVEIPSFCRTGICQTCLVRATSGKPSAKSQSGVSETLVQSGCFLACQCVPEGPLEVEPCHDVGSFATRVAHVEQLSSRVLRVELEAPVGFNFRAGQFVQLEREGGVTRPYSIASLPGSPRIELHVTLFPGGAMSQWLRWAVHQPVTLRGPFGECFYLHDELDRPLLLAGTGSGLAPLLGVLRDARAAGHRAAIHLYHGSTSLEGQYASAELQHLVETTPNLRVFASVLMPAEQKALPPRTAAASPAPASPAPASPAEPAARYQVRHEPLDRLILADPLDFFQCRVYLCGDPELVQRLRKRIYLSGAPLARIHCDPFLPPASATPASPM
ncbi:MAG: ferredoxin reductase [Pseudomonadota bacterium]|jgi:NAD(P)H-flavin reductase/ferredoxin